MYLPLFQMEEAQTKTRGMKKGRVVARNSEIINGGKLQHFLPLRFVQNNTNNNNKSVESCPSV